MVEDVLKLVVAQSMGGIVRSFRVSARTNVDNVSQVALQRVKNPE